MSLSASTKLEPDPILVSIGKGCMGELWKAHDPRLNRDVAIGVSAAQFRERFEASAIGALDRSNICIPHGAACCRFWRPQRKSQFDLLQRSGSR